MDRSPQAHKPCFHLRMHSAVMYSVRPPPKSCQVAVQPPCILVLCMHLPPQQECLKDARCANADMDDDALTSSRQVARLRHALEDSQSTLKEAQAALSQVGRARLGGGGPSHGVSAVMRRPAVCLFPIMP